MSLAGRSSVAPGALPGTLRRFLAGLADLVLPDVCAACEAATAAAEGLCEPCTLELLSLAALPYCPRCGSTIGPNIPPYESGCPRCPGPLPRFAHVFRLGPYTGPLRGLVRGLKYRRRHGVRRHMAELLAARVRAGCGHVLPDAVVPVPMHWLRRVSRGFDHAQAVASRLAAALDVPLGIELRRVRNTAAQVGLPRTRRLENMHGAFAVCGSAAGVRGAAILLVDDVTTTGATANEAARALLEAGANRVLLAVLAKTESPKAYAEQLRS
jgi:ComF family protein